jgi:fatty acid desaturase
VTAHGVASNPLELLPLVTLRRVPETEEKAVSRGLARVPARLRTALLAGSAGIWLFYVQHQFEDVYWQRAESWSYADAGLRGSSYLRLPKVLQFFTGNIGLHHLHHLNARIPNYNLQRAHDDNPAFHEVPTLSFWDGMRAVRLKLWDEDRSRLVTFAQARGASKRSPGGSQVTTVAAR